MADIVRAQDEQRVARSFISFLSVATGADQSLANQDNSAVNYPRQYTVIGNDGRVGIEGTSGDLGGMGFTLTAPVVLMLGAAAAAVFFFLKK